MDFKNGVPELSLNVAFGHSNRSWLFISENLSEGAHLPNALNILGPEFKVFPNKFKPNIQFSQMAPNFIVSFFSFLFFFSLCRLDLYKDSSLMNDPGWESFYWSTSMIQSRFEDRVKRAGHCVKWKHQCVQEEFCSVRALLEAKLHTTKENTRKGGRSSFIKKSLNSGKVKCLLWRTPQASMGMLCCF